MFESIGVLVVVIGVLLILFYISTRPNKEELRVNEIKRINAEKEEVKEKNKILFILKYKDLILNSFNYNSQINLEIITNKLTEIYNYNDSQIEEIIHEMKCLLMIDNHSNSNINTIEKGISLLNIKYVFPNFVNFCEFIRNTGNFELTSFSENYYLKQNIIIPNFNEDEKSSFRSFIEFGLFSPHYLTLSLSSSKFNKNDIFLGDYSIYIATHIGINYKGFLQTNNEYDNLKIKYLNFDKLGNYYIYKIHNLYNDLNFNEYQTLFYKFLEDFKNSIAFKEIYQIKKF